MQYAIIIYLTCAGITQEQSMLKSNFLKDLVTQLSETLPSHFSTFKNDFEKNCHQVLMHTFAKLDLVTREEFDTQTKVLSRTRKKLKELEVQLKSCENALKHEKHS
jgi:BMFP domain-containing protein YqiC